MGEEDVNGVLARKFNNVGFESKGARIYIVTMIKMVSFVSLTYDVCCKLPKSIFANIPLSLSPACIFSPADPCLVEVISPECRAPLPLPSLNDMLSISRL